MLSAAQTMMFSLFRGIRIRFGLRALLAATMLLGALFGLIGNEANRLRRHQEAVRKVHELGGRYISITGDTYGASWGPSWCPIVRDDLYADTKWVWFTSTANAGLRNEDLAILKHLPRLKVLQIAAPLITDEAMAHVERIGSLRELELYGTQVTGCGLRRLGGIRLEKLALGGPDVTDEALGGLVAFPALRKLMITETSVTDVGLAHLKHVPMLEKLFIAASPICDSGMDHVAKLPHLWELDLLELVLTDDGITPLATLPRLSSLYVTHTQVTEAGLLTFRDSRRLKNLGIAPQPTPETLRTLASALPDCQVFDCGGYRCMQGW